jgi:hypothetical protein
MATNFRWDTEQQNDSPSAKKSVIPAGIAGIQLPWMAITKHTIDWFIDTEICRVTLSLTYATNVANYDVQ